MKIRDLLNTITILSSAGIAMLIMYIWFNTYRIEQHLEQIQQTHTLSEKASEIYLIAEKYMAYGHPRYKKLWNAKFDSLRLLEQKVNRFAGKEEVLFSFPAIQNSFSMLHSLKT